MTLFRLNSYFLYVYYVLPELNFLEILQSFVAGIRFDILIFGFLFIPVYFMLMAQTFSEKWPPKFFYFYKTYFGIAWILICVLSYIDFLYFALHGQRMRFDQYESWSPELFMEQVNALQMNQVIVFTTISAVLLFLGHMLIKSMKFGEWKDEYSPHHGSRFEVVWRVLLPLILIFLAARGSVMPHHLALEHSQVSANKELNEMALNAVWCFDK